MDTSPSNENDGSSAQDSMNKSVTETVVYGDETALEERYNKLKAIAVKLKKKVGEQNDEIEKLKAENIKAAGKGQKISTIQQEFDKAQDEVERLKKLQFTSEKDLRSTVEENIKLKESNFESQSKLQSLTASHKILREKCDKLEKIEEEATKWKTRAEELENDLKGAKQTEVSAIQEKRQTALLSLEITDYEKKLQDISEKLDESKRQNENQAVLAAESDSKIICLELKITKLNDTIGDLNRAKTQSETDLGRKSEKICFLQDEITKLNEKLQDSKSELSKLNKELENAKFNFSNESSLLTEKCTNLEKVIRTLENKISALEENKRSRESFVSNLKLELNQLETEYSNYKLKAQAMLKSQKPATSISKDGDELENLQKIVQDFHSEISVLKSDYQTLKLENESLTLERAELGVQLSHLKADTIQKEVELGNEVQKFRQELRQKDMEMKHLLESAKTEKEAVVTAYKGQVESVKHSYELKIKGMEEEIRNLKYSKEADTADDVQPQYENRESAESDEDATSANPHDFGQRCISGDSFEGHHPALSGAHHRGNSITQPLTIDTSAPSLGMMFDQFRMIPRGECEGSESISSSRLIQTHDNYNLTFEQLLSSDSKENDGTTTPLFGPSLKEELIRCQNQIKHLTVLLRESESNSERLAQLSEALKEEIRRVERDNERKVHLKENTEYLKNILLKFVTLHGEDEKLRLVPVLKTMLKLAPNEVMQLETSVRGVETVNESRPGHSAATSGWSSYLPMWH